LQQAAGDAEDVVVVICDQPGVDPVGRDLVELPVVGVRVDSPEPSAAGVGQARGELVAEQPEEAEHDFGVAGGVGHDLAGVHAGLRVEQPVE